MIYQHPLAYLLGVEGIALLRAWAGDFDKDFVEARLAEVRRLVDDESLTNHDGVLVARGDTTTAYQQFAEHYDDRDNALFDFDEPVVHEILDALPAGTALDAACGTGRYAEHLIAQGHRVIGVDRSPDMLAHARERVPQGEFATADLQQLPLSDNAVDIVVCGLALCHVPALDPVLAEFARVLRPGGHLVISDPHHERILLGSVVHALGPAGEPGLAPTFRRTPGDFLRAALPVGFTVRRCEEPHPQNTMRPSPPDEHAVTNWHEWPWSLLPLVPEAAAATLGAMTIIWHFQLAV